MRVLAITAAAVLGLGGCASMAPQGDTPIETLQGPAPIRSQTPMREALACMADALPQGLDLRVGVSDVTDGTGATVDSDSISRALTQRPDLMLVVALSQAGVRLVNRSSTSVAEWEMKQALERRLGDGRSSIVGNAPVAFRPVPVGGLLGSTHYVTGALTELNWNIDSSVAEMGALGFSAGTRGYHISIAFDILVTNTTTTEISVARAYNKQLIGHEMKAGFFRFFDIGTHGSNLGPFELFEASVGQKKNEPVQTAVRWVVETAAYDIVRELSGVGDVCDHLLPGAALAGGSASPAAPAGGGGASPDSLAPIAPSDPRVPDVGPLRSPQTTPYVIPVIPGSVEEMEAVPVPGTGAQEAAAPAPAAPAGEKANDDSASAEPVAAVGPVADAAPADADTATKDAEVAFAPASDEQRGGVTNRLKAAGFGAAFGIQTAPY